MKNKWNREEIENWINNQSGPDKWYQTINLKDGITIRGSVNSLERLRTLNLPDNLSGKTVLDIGCNSGMLCIESKRRDAGYVLGIDTKANRLDQAKILAEIMGMDIDYKKMDLFQAASLGEFDIVYCIAVLTEITDLIGGLEILKQVTRGTLYLEIAITETYQKNQSPIINKLTRLTSSNLGIFRSIFKKSNSKFFGQANLRMIDTKYGGNWALVPDREFLNSIMGESFKIFDLGQSVRYHLFKMEKIKK